MTSVHPAIVALGVIVLIWIIRFAVRDEPWVTRNRKVHGVDTKPPEKVKADDVNTRDAPSFDFPDELQAAKLATRKKRFPYLAGILLSVPTLWLVGYYAVAGIDELRHYSFDFDAAEQIARQIAAPVTILLLATVGWWYDRRRSKC